MKLGIQEIQDSHEERQDDRSIHLALKIAFVIPRQLLDEEIGVGEQPLDPVPDKVVHSVHEIDLLYREVIVSAEKLSESCRVVMSEMTIFLEGPLGNLACKASGHEED